MKAVITSGNKQYLVAKDDVLEVDLLHSDKKSLSFEPLLIIDDKETLVGAPTVAGHTVTAEIVGETRGEKVLAIRYKAKKRVKKVHGSKQTYTQIKITSIK
jgi:large subunit ribosomal protein L21